MYQPEKKQWTNFNNHNRKSFLPPWQIQFSLQCCCGSPSDANKTMLHKRILLICAILRRKVA